MTTIWLMPLALGAVGLVLLCSAWLTGRRFDRRYPHLSRKGMREAEEREGTDRATLGASRIPVPPFHPEDRRMQSARGEAESERLDRSIHRWKGRMKGRSEGVAQPRSRMQR